MTPSVLQPFTRETTPTMASWLSDDDEKIEAERMEDKNYESDLDWEERPSFFAIHPKVCLPVPQGELHELTSEKDLENRHATN